MTNCVSNNGYYECDCGEWYLSNFPYRECNCLSCGKKVLLKEVIKGNFDKISDDLKKQKNGVA